MEGKTHYERVVGGKEEERKAASKELQNLFNEKREDFSKYEIKKTPEDLKIIEIVETAVDDMVLGYGGVIKDLPLDHIHILKPGDVSDITKGRHLGGIHFPLSLNVGVEKDESKLLFASTLAHELFHLKSYKSARVSKSGEGALLYRSGLSMIDKKDISKNPGEEKEYFGVIEEAIVTECARKVLDKISGEEIFKNESEPFEKFKDLVRGYYLRIGMPEDNIRYFEENFKYTANPGKLIQDVLLNSSDIKKQQAYAAGMFEYLYKNEKVEVTERYNERRKMYKFFDKIIVSSNGEFKNRDEIFDMFAKANFSGNYIPLARKVEEMFGEGSFRKLAEEFSQMNKEDFN